MVAPTLQAAAATGTVSTSGTTVSPTHGGSVGDLVIILVECNANPGTISITTGTGWTATAVRLSGGAGTLQPSSFLIYKKLDGTGDSPTVTGSASFRCVWISTRWNGDPAITIPTSSFGAAGQINPPAATPAAGSNDYTYAAFGGNDQASGNITAAPSGYSGLTTVTVGASPVTAAFAYKSTSATTTEDPGTFTGTAGSVNGWTVAIAPGANTGTSTVTEANDTPTATGAVLLQGASSATEANDVPTATAVAFATGTSSATEQNDTPLGTGIVRSPFVSNVVEQDDTGVGTSTLKIQAAQAVTEANDVPTATAVARASAGGNVTEANDVPTATAVALLQGSGSVTEGNDTPLATGQVRSGAVSTVVEANDTPTATGIVFARGAYSITEANDISSAFAQVGLGAPDSRTVALTTGLLNSRRASLGGLLATRVATLPGASRQVSVK